ncbi:MAG TPA: helix-hairpin-helix domain-containing protein, partial [Candidatus Paceibacterota bacterium]
MQRQYSDNDSVEIFKELMPDGVGTRIAATFKRAGFETLDRVRRLSPEGLSKIPGMGDRLARHTLILMRRIGKPLQGDEEDAA